MTTNPLKSAIIDAISVFLIFSGCLLIYSNSFHVPFVFDDRPFIVNDTSVHISDLSFANFTKAAFDGYPGQRPLSNVTFALNYFFNKLKPTGYHVVNIVLHSITGVFLFFLFRLTSTLAHFHNDVKGRDSLFFSLGSHSNSWIISFLAVSVWLIHPLHTESVTYVCQRMTSLTAMFYILSLWLYVKARLAPAIPDRINHQRIFFFLGSAAVGGLAVLSKPNAATLPVVILLFEWFFFRNLNIDGFKHRALWIVFVSILVCGFSIIFLGNAPADKILSAYTRREFSLLQRVLTESRVVIYYIGLIVFPHYKRLNLDYGYPLSDNLTAPPETILAILAIAGLVWAGLSLSKKEPLIGFGILWFLANLVIESSVIGLEIIFEHRTYLPSMFLILSLTALLFRLVPYQRVIVGMLGVIIIVFGYWTWQRNEIWQDEQVLWQDCAAKSPEKARSHYNLACLLLQRDQTDKSIFHFYKAVTLKPGSPEIHYNLGCALVKKQSFTEAMAQFAKTLALDPDHADAHNNLANVLSKKGKKNIALEHYRRAAQLRPKNAEYHSNFAAALFSFDKIDEAIAVYQKAQQLDPENVAILNRLGYALFRKGHTDEAMSYFMKVLELSPDNAEAHGRIGDVRLKANDYQQAEYYYMKALEINPNDAQSHYNLGIVCSKTGRLKEAMDHFKQAVTISPDLLVPEFLIE